MILLFSLSSLNVKLGEIESLFYIPGAFRKVHDHMLTLFLKTFLFRKRPGRVLIIPWFLMASDYCDSTILSNANLIYQN